MKDSSSTKQLSYVSICKTVICENCWK